MNTKISILFLLTGVLVSPSFSSDISYGLLTDNRDGQTYKTVVIGTQTWMAQNLNYSGGTNGLRAYTMGWCYGVGGTDTTQHQDSTTCGNGYGRIYHWADAMDISPTYLTTTAAEVATNRTTNTVVSAYGNNRGLCPKGWHVPTDADWVALFKSVGGKSVAGDKLKTVTGWSSNTGLDHYGFSALPTGFRRDGSWFGRTYHTYYWTSIVYINSAWSHWLYYNHADEGTDLNPKASGNSLRCIMD